MLLLILLVISVVFIILLTVRLKLHPFLALIFTAFGFGICAGMPLSDVAKAVNAGFGDTVGTIGIVILAGALIGTFLEKSGGAYRVAEAILRVTGKKNVPLAMSVIGYIVSIPVFCDSGFVLLSPLNHALARKAKVSLAACAIALSLGLYATHVIVPPTPGPVGAAGIIGADLGLVILWGMPIAAIATLAGWLFAIKVAAKTEAATQTMPAAAAQADPAIDEAPSAARSLVPILLPIVLIIFRSTAELPMRPFGEGGFSSLLSFLGTPVVALLLGVLIAFMLPRKLTTAMVSTSGWVGEAIIGAAAIIIITGAGGSFGRVLKDSGISEVVKTLFAGHEGIGILLPFLIAAGLKTAQGSSTVAIITTASLVVPLLPSLGLDAPNARALVVVAIGAGSMIVSHANDSYFWVVTQFSNMSVNQGYKLQSLGTLVVGVTTGILVWVLSLIVL
jgi:GntP family gluconate:H+ symporter